MIERYTLPQMQKLWSDENKFRKWVDIEILACEAQAKLGNIPKSVVPRIRKKADFNVKKINRIEKKVKHDVIAFLTNLAEYIGEDSKYVHLGMTSYDVVDTALSLLLKDAGNLILSDLQELGKVIKKKSFQYKNTPMIGRTHGVQAEPMSLGLKFALWYAEIERDIERLNKAIKMVSVGKLSGAVGNFAHLSPKVEEYVCRKAGLTPASVSTQILQRDRHAEFVTTIAIIAGSIEKFATEIRNLQRTEVLELEESFTKGQKGSSAMPHKRNPFMCERLTGMARVVRGCALTALENANLWHERDITNSAVERVILPDSTSLLDYMLVNFKKIMENLTVYPENMLRNINLTKGLVFSQRVLTKLTQKTKTREEAYALVQENAMRAWNTGESFKELVLKDQRIKKYLSQKEILDCLDLKYYLRNVDYIFKRVFTQKRKR
jgi:adenylosuccinate lyase